MTPPLTPTQADRDAAAKQMPLDTLAEAAAIEQVRHGKRDNHHLVQAFARHAQAARLEGARAMREAAAKLADKRAEACRMAGLCEGIDPIEAQILDEHLSEAASAIRDLDPLSIAEKGV